MQNINKNSKPLILAIILGLLILYPALQNSFEVISKSEMLSFDRNKPKNAGYWDLTGTPIVIIGNSQWSTKYAAQPWFSGSGSWSDPYIIENVTIDGQNTGSCIRIRDSTVYYIIRNCTLYNAGNATNDSGLNIWNADNGLLIDNNCSYNGYDGIWVYQSQNVTILNNTLHYNRIEGIHVRDSTEIRIVENDASFSLILEGMRFTNSNNVNITKNKIYNNNQEGIELYGGVGTCYDFRISENELLNNLGGIYLENGNNNEIFNNIIDNSTEGIMFAFSSGNIISNNYISNCSNRALAPFTTSANNLFYENHLLDNSVNANDQGTGNDWNTTVVGNYWDDYGGVDANDDGIGDTQHSFTGNIDYFPIWDDGFDGSKIHIDDTGLNSFDWAWASTRTSWCSGSGTHDDPYMIEGLTINAGSVGTPIFIESSSVYFVIRNCNLTYSQATGVDAGIKLEDVYNGKIVVNNITDNYVGIKLIRSDNNTINSNYILDNAGQGIVLQSSEDNVIVGNTANNSLYYGLVMNSQSHNNTVEENTFGNNKGASGYGSGIRIDDSDDCEVSENILNDNDQGIRIVDNSHDNEIYDNIIHNNAKFGVLIQDLSRDCTNSVFYNNTFINPLGINAYDNGSNSLWDNGLIGNYWNDYGGADADDDIVGDTPYLIGGEANSQDNLPIWDDGDIVYPTVIRNSPSAPFNFGATAPTFNLTIFDLHLHMAWYKVNDTYTHFFTPVNGINIIQIDQNSWDSLTEGSLSIGFFVNDTSGNLLTMGLSVSKELPPEQPPSTPGIPFGNYYLIFLGVGVLALLITQLKRRK